MDTMKRRNFLGTAVAAALSAARSLSSASAFSAARLFSASREFTAAGLLSATGTLAPFDALRAENAKTKSSDIRCDVLVVGAGGAGLAAAYEASLLSKRVLLIEKESFIGGDTLKSGGYYNAPDPAAQVRYAVNDSPEFYFEQMQNSAAGAGNPRMRKRLSEEAFSTLTWLKELGVVFEDNLYKIYGSGHLRCHKPVLSLGQAYIRHLSEACLKNGVRILTQTRLVDFTRTEEGQFVAQTQSSAKGLIIASRSLILTAGGFGNNPALLKRYKPDLNFYYSDSNGTGEVMETAIRRGVRAENLESVECIPEGSLLNKFSARIYILLNGMVFINEEGNRFADEESTRKELTEALIRQGRKKCYTIVDADNLKRLDKFQLKHLYQCYFAGQAWKSDSIEGLCAMIGVPPETLKASLAGLSEARRPKKAPFWAVRMYPWVHYTLGGLSIDEEARALDQSGRPIPGLFAAGQITGSVHGANRLGGNGLTDAFVFGRIAGRNGARYAREICSTNFSICQ